MEDGNKQPILITDSVIQFSKDSDSSSERCVSNDSNISSVTPLTFAEWNKSEEKERNRKIYDMIKIKELILNLFYLFEL